MSTETSSTSNPDLRTEEEKEILRQQRRERRKLKRQLKKPENQQIYQECRIEETSVEHIQPVKTESPTYDPPLSNEDFIALTSDKDALLTDEKKKTSKRRVKRKVPDFVKVNQRKAYVGNLVFDVAEDDLKEAFKDFAIETIEMTKDAETGKFYGVAFIVFDTKETAQKAAQAMNGVELKRRPMRVEVKNTNKKNKTEPKEDKKKNVQLNDGCTLFVAGINDHVTDDMIIAHFSRVGKVVSFRRMYDKVTKAFKGSGFIEYLSKFYSKRAMKFNQTIFHNKKLRVEYAKERTIS